MAGIERLVPTDQLRTSLLVKLASEGRHPLFLDYDKNFDALRFLVVPLDVPTVVHYVDRYVALLYQPDDFEIVGLQVENFVRSFLPNHAAVQRLWKLSDTGTIIKDFGEMVIIVEEIKPQVARAVVKATEDLLGEPGADLAAILA